MKFKVAKEIHFYGDLHRIPPLLAFKSGYKVREVRIRKSGQDLNLRIYISGIYLRRLLDILVFCCSLSDSQRNRFAFFG